MKHTNKPWTVVEGRTHGSIEVFSGDTAIAEIWRRGDAQQERAIAQRIVACVNSCEGFSIEELEGANLFKDSIESQSEIVALKQQRDELLKALRGLRDAFLGTSVEVQADAMRAARAAIAKAGGES